MPAPFKAPNLYQLSGDGITITYATTSFTGQPSFTYHDAAQNLTFTGAQIQSVDTEAGTVVSVVIRMTVDTGSTTFSVLIPRVNLGEAESANITTHGITALHRFSILPQTGQLDIYTSHQLAGTASLVFFVAPLKP
jgi:hypothetical protein